MTLYRRRTPLNPRQKFNKHSRVLKIYKIGVVIF